MLPERQPSSRNCLIRRMQGKDRSLRTDEIDFLCTYLYDLSTIDANQVSGWKKSDLEASRQVKTEEGKNLACSLEIKFLETSAKDAMIHV